MFDAPAFYQLRSEQYTLLQRRYGSVYPRPGTKDWNKAGWEFRASLDLAKTETIPFKYGPRNFGVRVKKWGTIRASGNVYQNGNAFSDGTLIKSRTRMKGRSEMRRLLNVKIPLLANFDVYKDFNVYPNGYNGINPWWERGMVKTCFT